MQVGRPALLEAYALPESGSTVEAPAVELPLPAPLSGLLSVQAEFSYASRGRDALLVLTETGDLLLVVGALSADGSLELRLLRTLCLTAPSCEELHELAMPPCLCAAQLLCAPPAARSAAVGAGLLSSGPFALAAAASGGAIHLLRLSAVPPSTANPAISAASLSAFVVTPPPWAAAAGDASLPLSGCGAVVLALAFLPQRTDSNGLDRGDFAGQRLLCVLWANIDSENGDRTVHLVCVPTHCLQCFLHECSSACMFCLRPIISAAQLSSPSAPCPQDCAAISADGSALRPGPWAVRNLHPSSTLLLPPAAAGSSWALPSDSALVVSARGVAVVGSLATGLLMGVATTGVSSASGSGGGDFRFSLVVDLMLAGLPCAVEALGSGRLLVLPQPC